MSARLDASANLDQLRALAVLLVLGDHVLETVGQANGYSFHPYDYHLGRLGVLLFFVHTCLVLMRSLQRLDTRGEGLFFPFYVRRCFRIYPLALLCVALTQLLSIPVRPWDAFAPTQSWALVSNLLLTMNLTGTPVVLAPLWSLPLELQMYLLLPFIYLLVSRCVPSRALWWTGGLWLVAVVLGIAQHWISDRLSVFAFGPCFMAGVIAFVMTGRVTPKISGYAWLPLLLLLAFAYIGAAARNGEVHFKPLQWFVCLIVGAAIPLFRDTGERWLNSAAKVIARYSYGVYLFHCVALWFAFQKLHLHSVAAQLAVTIAVLVPLCVGCYHFLEEPLIKLGALPPRLLFTVTPRS